MEAAFQRLKTHSREHLVEFARAKYPAINVAQTRRTSEIRADIAKTLRQSIVRANPKLWTDKLEQIFKNIVYADAVHRVHSYSLATATQRTQELIRQGLPLRYNRTMKNYELKHNILRAVREKFNIQRLERILPNEVEIEPDRIELKLTSPLSPTEEERMMTHYRNHRGLLYVSSYRAINDDIGSVGSVQPANLARVINDEFDRLARMYEDEDFYTIIVSFEPIRQRLHRVAFGRENCLLRCIEAKMGRAAVQRVYERMPELKPPEAPEEVDVPIWVYREQLDSISRIANITLRTYSEIGAQTGEIWEEFGGKKRTVLNVKVAREHATLMTSRVQPQAIKYFEHLTDKEENELVASINLIQGDFEALGAIGESLVRWYMVIEDSQLVMYKRYRPSTLTNMPESDSALEFSRVHSHSGMLMKCFRKRFSAVIQPTPKVYKAAIKNSEMFIPRGLLTKDFPKDLVEIDHNSNYLSGKWGDSSSKYYEGFPEAFFFPSAKLEERPEHLYRGLTPAFVIISKCKMEGLLATAFTTLYGKIPECIPYPMFRFLRDRGAEFTVVSCLYARHHEINIPEWAEQYKQFFPDPAEFKRARLALIGQAIAGGLGEIEERKFYGIRAVEMEQLKYEANVNKYEFFAQGTEDDDYEITIKMPKKESSGSFHYHTYILAYAGIEMLSKYMELSEVGAQIIAFNVDSITATRASVPERFLTTTRELGKWKHERFDEIKPFYQRLKRVVKGESTYIRTLPDDHKYTYRAPSHSSKLPINDRILITGAAGIGKSYNFLNEPYPGQMCVSPMVVLRESQRLQYPNVMTTQKYHGLSLTTAARKKQIVEIQLLSPVVICDEFTMLTQQNWETIVDLSDSDRSALIVLGGPGQVCKAVDGTPINVDWFRANEFSVVDIERTPEMQCRHAFEYGCFLDLVRDLEDPDTQMREAIAYTVAGKRQYKVISTPADLIRIARACETKGIPLRVVVGTNSLACDINALAKARLNSMPFKVLTKGNTKGQTKILQKADFEQNPTIWWDHKACKDKAPLGKTLEPVFACTIDSFQGQTFDGIIVIDLETMNRDGTFYTALTRTRVAKNTVFLQRQHLDDVNK